MRRWTDDPDRSLLDAIADERTPDPEKVLQRRRPACS
jgi:hypothetical protein